VCQVARSLQAQGVECLCISKAPTS
jgi:hypothetical protein